jgi:hypothetical protein
MVNEPEKVKEWMEWFLPRAMELSTDKAHLHEKVEMLMNELFERAVGKQREGGGSGDR